MANLQLPVKLPSVCIWNCFSNFLLNDVAHVAFILYQFDPAKLRKLRPSFKENGGTVTAGNASSIRSIPKQGQKFDFKLRDYCFLNLHTKAFEIYLWDVYSFHSHVATTSVYWLALVIIMLETCSFVSWSY